MEEGVRLAIITTANYKTWKSIAVTTWDALLDILIPAAQARAERFCGRTFDYGTFTEKYDADGDEVILLKSWPVTSITSITHRDTGLVAAADYTFVPLTGETRLLNAVRGRFPADDYGQIEHAQFGVSPNFGEGFKALTVVYIAGYGGAGAYSFPADLSLAMYQYVDQLFVEVKDGALPDKSLKSETLGKYSYTRMDAAEEDKLLARLFGPFRRGAP